MHLTNHIAKWTVREPFERNVTHVYRINHFYFPMIDLLLNKNKPIVHIVKLIQQYTNTRIINNYY